MQHPEAPVGTRESGSDGRGGKRRGQGHDDLQVRLPEDRDRSFPVRGRPRHDRGPRHRGSEQRPQGSGKDDPGEDAGRDCRHAVAPRIQVLTAASWTITSLPHTTAWSRHSGNCRG